MKIPELGIIALTPAAWTGKEFHPGIALAAARAGALGVLDLGYLDQPGEAELAVELLAKERRGGVGIKCGVEQVASFQPLFARLSKAESEEKIVIVAVRDKSFSKKTLSAAIASVQKQQLKAFCEVVNLEEALLAASCGADAIIASGHESGGRVGEETSFVILQRCVRELKVPIWIRGGIGLNSAAAILAGGGAGVVLDSQLLLLRESPLSAEQKERLSTFDGTETEEVKFEKEKHRIWVRPGTDAPRILSAEILAQGSEESIENWRSSLRKELCAAHLSPGQLPSILTIGQDIAYAGGFARRFLSVASLVQQMRISASSNLKMSIAQRALDADAPLAKDQLTRFPVLQGAMTRVSDVADFALKVAADGGLPFLACALMRKEELQPLLEKTQRDLGAMSWGVGMLGFVPAELRQEQLELVLKFRPPFALIAGGRPDQAKELESNGTKTYLHVPSPILLTSFIELGARRFIFEGKECGGHVGPRSSLVLWEAMIDALLAAIPPKADASEYNIVFAGGIHDDRSAAMLAAMAAPLVERGIRIGVLMGTAYLFTKEAVSTGAIVPRFQEEALKCKETVLLETGPGHAIRCINSPYKELFDNTRRKLESSGCGKNELRQELEMMNLGRLRVASKGLTRGQSTGKSGSKLVEIESEKQWSEGMYMIGQVAALHDKTITIKKLHESVTVDACKYLEKLDLERKSLSSVKSKRTEEPIAIIGMSCLFPKANDLETYWENILNKVDAIEEIPKEQFDWSLMYSQDPLARDKISSRWGGFLSDIPFDPSVYGIPPSSLASIDPAQLIILEVTRAAIHDAGYSNRPFPKDRSSVVLAQAGHGSITSHYSLRSMLDWTLSDLEPEYRKKLEQRLPEWTEDSFPGYLGNVIAGRVANRFDLGGLNFCVDAACASSLAALYIGIRELRSGSSDMVLLAATDTHNQPGDYLSFSKTHALSPRGRCRTFDATADGIAISEGMAVLVLKRLSDAERDGDRIYAVLKGIGGSSDGRDLSLTAPRPAGQMSALKRAYEDADLSPATVELVEAHGTGTVAGDRAEVEALSRIFESAGAEQQVCAVGSVKTMIGHTKCAAGLASVIKIAKSLYHKVLPPTIGVENPSPACKFDSSPFYINSESRPWLHDSERLGYPRRAGVSAFGFGGTNFHTVLEEYTPQKYDRQEGAYQHFPTELFVLRSGNRPQMERSLLTLKTACEKLIALNNHPQGPIPLSEPASLFDLAYRHYLTQTSMPPLAHAEESLLALIVSTPQNLLEKIAQALDLLKDETKKSVRDPRGILFEEGPKSDPGKVAFLFPGQGSQHVDMLKDLCLAFGEYRHSFEKADRILSGKFETALSRYIYPTPAFSESERTLQSEKLTDTHVAQPAVAAAGMASYQLLTSFGIRPDMCAGHSFGEYVALAASGVMSEEELYSLSERRGDILKTVNNSKGGSMTAVSAGGAHVRNLLGHLSDVTLANVNSPRQCIISGGLDALERAHSVLSQNKIKAKPIAVSAAFHSPLMKPAVQELSQALLRASLKTPQVKVYSNTLAKAYPTEPGKIASLLCEHLVKPVEFQAQIEQMYEDGARVFVECGPSAVLSGLVSDILEGKEHTILTLERAGRNGLTQVQNLLAQAFVGGLDPDLGRLYKHRAESTPAKVDSTAGNTASNKMKLMYWVNGAHIKRFDGKIAIPANRPTEQAFRYAEKQNNATAVPMSQIQMPGQSQAAPSVKTTDSKPAPATMQNSASFVSAKNSVPGQQPALSNQSIPASSTSATAASAQPASRSPQAGHSQSDMKRVVHHSESARPNPAAPANVSQNNQQQNVPVAKSGRDQVMLEFQRTMMEMTNTFLQSQEKVMIAFLQKSADGTNVPGAQLMLQDPSESFHTATSDNRSGATSNATTLGSANNLAKGIAAGTGSSNSSGGLRGNLDGQGNGNVVGYASENGNGNGNGNFYGTGNGTGNQLSHHSNASNNHFPGNGNSTGEFVGNGSGEFNNTEYVSTTGNAPSAASLDAEKLISSLIEIVSERTGYPAEMLDPVLDLEADLGIDSIKRVEILNSFRKLLPDEVQSELENGIEKLAATKTLQGITDWIRNDLVVLNKPSNEISAGSGDAPVPVIDQATSVSSKQSEPLQNPLEVNSAYIGRALVELKELPSLSNKLGKVLGLYVLSNSGDAITKNLQAALEKCGAEVLVINHKPGTVLSTGSLTGNNIDIDLCNEELVQSFAAQLIEARGRVAGLIHLLPLSELSKTANLKSKASSEPESCEKQEYTNIRSLFVMARAFAALSGSSAESPVMFTTARLGGSFGIENASSIDPVQGALPGFVKTFAREYPKSRARCIDFAEDIDKKSIADLIMQELFVLDQALTEVAYKGNLRRTVVATPTALETDERSGTLGTFSLKPGSLVLVTGGARGITAELCLELAERYKPTFVIVGRGQRPAGPEEKEYSGLETPKEIKAAIMDSLRRKGQTLSVPTIESIYQKLLREREIRRNLERLEASGSRVHYHAMDVRDRQSFSELIDRLYESFGKIDAVIHGAGVIEDAYLKVKTLASFDRVFGTKVDSALTLASRLQFDTLKHLVLFSSVVGRTGNAGQVDYVCANEVMNKLASKLNDSTDARILSIMWGPWRGGMAQPELESLFASFGWSMIENSGGRKSFIDELAYGSKNDSEVLLVGQINSGSNGTEPAHTKHAHVYASKAETKPGSPKGNGNGNGNGNGHAPSNGGNGHGLSTGNGSSNGNGHKNGDGTSSLEDRIRPRGARLNRAEILKQEATALDLRLRMDPEFDLYLKDHAFDSMPILPMAVATELLAESVQYLYPDFELSSIEKLEIPAGVMFENGARDLYLSVRELSRSGTQIKAEVWLSTTTNSNRKNFKAIAALESQRNNCLPDASRLPLRYDEFVLPSPEAQTMTVEYVYRNWLFHGPLFQGIGSIDKVGTEGICGVINAIDIDECLKDAGKERWLIDPIMLDSAMQFAGIWARHYMDITVLPVGFGKLSLFAAPNSDKFHVIVSVPNENKNGELLCDMAIYNEDGQLVALMEKLAGAGSKSLNRLGSQPKALRGAK